MDKICLKNYLVRMPPEIDLDEFSSIKHLQETAFRRFPQHWAYRNLRKTLTYAQVDRLSRDFAAWVRGLILKKGQLYSWDIL